jgi:hypothetical protein
MLSCWSHKLLFFFFLRLIISWIIVGRCQDRATFWRIELCEKILEIFDIIAFDFRCLVTIFELMKAFNGATRLDNDFALCIREFIELILIVWTKNVCGELF